LGEDLGIFIEGDKSKVLYNITYGVDKEMEPLLKLGIDWEIMTYIGGETNDLEMNDVAIDLFRNVKNAVAEWYNVSGALQCFNVCSELSEGESEMKLNTIAKEENEYVLKDRNLIGLESERKDTLINSASNLKTSAAEICQSYLDIESVWVPLICNENFYVINYYAYGEGVDFMWPPAYGKDISYYNQTVGSREFQEEIYSLLCADPYKLYGFPDKKKC